MRAVGALLPREWERPWPLGATRTARLTPLGESAHLAAVFHRPDEASHVAILQRAVRRLLVPLRAGLQKRREHRGVAVLCGEA